MRTRLRSEPGLWYGLVALVVATVVYSTTQRATGQPLAVFVLPPLLTAVVSAPVVVAAVGAASVATAVGFGLGSDLRPLAVVTRIGIVALGVVIAVVTARLRHQQQERLESARVRLAMSDTFQIGLVPTPNPPVGVSVDVQYRPGERGLLLGGDFLDVITLPDGTGAFVIGDVSGHGARAAAFGTAVRAGWKSVAYSRPDQVDRWLDLVEEAFFCDHRFDGFVTALTGRIDPTSGEVTIASAGHPWPVILGGPARLLPLDPGPPLGVVVDADRHINRTRLGDGTSLLCYTDGIIENAWSPGGRAGEDGLLDVIDRLGDRFALRSLLRELGPEGYQDDVALLWLRHEDRSPV